MAEILMITEKEFDMNKQEIKQALVEVFSLKDILGMAVDSATINDDTSLKKNLGMDSLRMLNLLVAVENRFQIIVDPSNLSMKDFDKFSKLVDYIDDKLNN